MTSMGLQVYEQQAAAVQRRRLNELIHRRYRAEKRIVTSTVIYRLHHQHGRQRKN